MMMPKPSRYKYEVVHTDGASFSIHDNLPDAEYWRDRIGGRIIDYVPRHEREQGFAHREEGDTHGNH